MLLDKTAVVWGGSTTIPLVKKGQKSFCVTEDALAGVHAEPTLLLVVVTMPFLKFVIAMLHAPHAESKVDLHKWWDEFVVLRAIF